MSNNQLVDPNLVQDVLMRIDRFDEKVNQNNFNQVNNATHQRLRVQDRQRELDSIAQDIE